MDFFNKKFKLFFNFFLSIELFLVILSLLDIFNIVSGWFYIVFLLTSLIVGSLKDNVQQLVTYQQRLFDYYNESESLSHKWLRNSESIINFIGLFTFIYSSNLTISQNKIIDLFAKMGTTMILIYIFSVFAKILTAYFERYKLETDIFNHTGKRLLHNKITARSIDNHEIHFQVKETEEGIPYYSEEYYDSYIEMKTLMNYSQEDWELFFKINPEIVPFLRIAIQMKENDPDKEFPTDQFQFTEEFNFLKILIDALKIK